MKTLIKKQLVSVKDTTKGVTITVAISKGFKVKEVVKKNVRKEIDVLAQYLINNMKEE